MKRLLTSAAFGVAAAGVLLAQTDEADRIREASVVFEEIMAAPDKGIPGSVLAGAEGIAIFPGALKGGFILAAQRGRGLLVVRRRAANTWSSPAFLTLTAGSVGLQIGGQATDFVLVIQNRRGLEYLLRNQFKIGADASVAAGPIGREAEASTDLQLRAEMLSYSRSRGLFAGISLEGASIVEDRNANGRFYGTRYRTREIVFDGKGGTPAPVSLLLATLQKHVRSRS
jgi:lipid-binding SYLF domain-containing protein